MDELSQRRSLRGAESRRGRWRPRRRPPVADGARVPSPGFEAALRELLDHHLLEPDVDGTGYVFRHAPPRRRSTRSRSPGERSRLHATFAHALEKDPSLAHVGPCLRRSSERGTGITHATSSRLCPRGSRRRPPRNGFMRIPRRSGRTRAPCSSGHRWRAPATSPGWTRSSFSGARQKPRTGRERRHGHWRWASKHSPWSTREQMCSEQPSSSNG